MCGLKSEKGYIYYLKPRSTAFKLIANLPGSNKGAGNDYFIVSGNWEFSPDDDLHLYPSSWIVFKEGNFKDWVILLITSLFRTCQLDISSSKYFCILTLFCSSSPTGKGISAILRAQSRSKEVVRSPCAKAQGASSTELHTNLQVGLARHTSSKQDSLFCHNSTNNFISKAKSGLHFWPSWSTIYLSPSTNSSIPAPMPTSSSNFCPCRQNPQPQTSTFWVISLRPSKPTYCTLAICFGTKVTVAAIAEEIGRKLVVVEDFLANIPEVVTV